MLGLVGMELAFLEALALIALACVFVPLSRALGLGTVIGYLVAGVVAGIGVSISFTRDPGELLHFAEFGVVLFLFVIGLEFRPARLWEMRGTIFGRGLAQVMVCAALLTVAALLTGLDWRGALIIGLGLALSSTALVGGVVLSSVMGTSYLMIEKPQSSDRFIRSQNAHHHGRGRTSRAGQNISQKRHYRASGLVPGPLMPI